ncbi:hypothetical protein BDZ89DRAFT_378414 [Hymenopellis radicata]|nr:hypothetical protein BDZ89DRAFT_378414 [Hymenopellis radicata]
MFRSLPVVRSFGRATQVVRRMSSTSGSSPAKHHYFVYAPDSKDGDRFAVRERHLREVQPGVESGIVRIGGMMLKPGTDHDASKIEPHGSVLILEAENLESVREMMMKDIYYTSGVWDKDAITITPLKLAISEPLSKLQ